MDLFFKKISFLKIAAILTYVVVNAMFVLKYGTRQDFCSPYVLLFLYVSFLFSGLFFIENQRAFIDNYKKFNRGFIIGAVVFFLLFVVINFLVDENALNIDRWSALEVSIDSFVHFKYPYDKLDHLNGTSSALPGMMIIALPFYLIGDVGLLQPFVFLVTMSIIWKSALENHRKLTFIFLLISSVAFLWEVIVKSDLMTNVILILLFMFYWNNTYKNEYFKNPIKLAFCLSVLILTRGFVIIPLVIFLFQSFFREKVKVKLMFCVSFLLSLLILLLPILISLPDLQTMIAHNPLFNQTAYAPFWLTILFILAPFFISFLTKNFPQKLHVSFVLIGSLIMGLFIYNAYDEGWNANLYGGLFDISYLGIIIPFVIFSITHASTTIHSK